MDEVYIDLRKYAIGERFPGKDFVSLEDFTRNYEDLLYELHEKEEEIETLESNIKDYYTPKSPYEIYGVSRDA